MDNVFQLTRRSLLGLTLSSAVCRTLSSGQRAAPATRAAGTFQWPASGLCRVVIPNGNEYLVDYVHQHPDWFYSGELILCLEITRKASESAADLEKKYQSDRQSLERQGLIVGTYISGTTILPQADENLWPFPAVPTEMLPPGVKTSGTWPHAPTRLFIDVADLSTCRAVESQIEAEWARYPAPLRFVDNAGAHRATGATQPWSGYCRHIKALRQIAQGQGSHVVFNIAMHAGMMSAPETTVLMDAIGQEGVLVEDPWTPYVRNTPVETERAQDRYRQLLDSGMAVFMLVNNVPADALFSWAGSWRKPQDRLYLGVPFFKKPALPEFCVADPPAAALR